MDSQGAQKLQLGEELSSTDDDAASIAAREYAKDLHTALPGIVQSFDRTTQTVRVKLTIKRLWIDDEIGWQPLPDLVDCPVQFPRFGNFIITGPVRANDEGLVHFAERSIDNWWHRGGIQEPSEYRLHDLSDGFFSPGYSSRVRAADVVGGAAGDALELRTLNGSTVLRIEGDVVYVGAKLGAEKMLLAESFTRAFGQFLDIIGSTHTGVATLPQVATAINALGVPAKTLSQALSTFLARKGKVA
jgi:hypothetical protein